MQFSIALLKSKFKALSWPKKILAILGFIISLHWLYFFYLIFFFPPVTLTQLNGLIHADQFHRDYVCIDDVSKYGKLAFIAAEDQLFLDHFGFDMESIDVYKRQQQDRPLKYFP